LILGLSTERAISAAVALALLAEPVFVQARASQLRALTPARPLAAFTHDHAVAAVTTARVRAVVAKSHAAWTYFDL
jgi:hypothetical protein